MIYGIDISHHQGGSFDLRRAAREGIEFAILKATEGSTFVDSQFGRNLREARAAGLLVAAYHYQRSGVSAAAQADHIAARVPRDVPVIQDVEDGGGGVTLTRQLHDQLRRRGYTVPLLYLPEWYWRQIGSPDLRGLPPLWYSRYPDYEGGSAAAIWQRSAAWFDQFWGGYGGLRVGILQFTSSATVAGHRPVDANAYRGTRRQLADLLGGQQQEDDVDWFEPKYRDRWGNPQHLAGTFNNLIGFVLDVRKRQGAQDAMLRELASKLNVDMEAIEQAAERGAAEALAGEIEITGSVEISNREDSPAQ